MFKPPALDEIVSKLSDVIPPGLDEVNDKTKEQVKSVLQKWLQEMDFVSREEFDVQKAVLQKTRAKLDAIEKRLVEMDQTAD